MTRECVQWLLSPVFWQQIQDLPGSPHILRRSQSPYIQNASEAFLEMEIAFLMNDMSYFKATDHLVARWKSGISHHSFSAAWQRIQRRRSSVSSTALRQT